MFIDYSVQFSRTHLPPPASPKPLPSITKWAQGCLLVRVVIGDTVGRPSPLNLRYANKESFPPPRRTAPRAFFT